MRRLSRFSSALFVVACLVSTALDGPLSRPPLKVSGFRVLEVDLHVHSFFGDGFLAPWDLVLEARRKGLDAFAITNHNQVFAAKLGRSFSRLVSGPTVLVGEEVTAPSYHIAAVGLETKVAWGQSAADTIRAVHAQGGVAIAAHPVDSYWPSYPDEATRILDGAEVAHPVAFRPKGGRQLVAFFERARSLRPGLAPIGSSDFHVLSRLGVCRTFVFAEDAGEGSLMEALRAGRTVVFTPDGRAFGDEVLASRLRTALAERGPDREPTLPRATDALCRVLGLLSLLGMLLGLGVQDRPKEPTP